MAFGLLSGTFFLGPIDPGALLAQSSGRALFEQAYRTEAEDPHKAMQLYRQALARGLDGNLRRTAHIRLNFLQKKVGGPPPSDADSPGGFNPNTIGRELGAAGVPKRAVDNFLRGLRLLNEKGTPENPEPFMAFWRPALQQSPLPALRIQMARALAASGKARRGIALIDEVDAYRPEYGIVKADLLLQTRRPEDARMLLLNLAARHDMNEKSKVRILYLLGRIARDEKNTLGAVRYFRLASRYGDRGQQVRYRSLAAFTLYKANMPLQARGLMRGLPTRHNRNIHLLDLILRVQVDNEKQAREELSAMLPEITRRVDSGGGSFLERRALEILGRR